MYQWPLKRTDQVKHSWFDFFTTTLHIFVLSVRI